MLLQIQKIVVAVTLDIVIVVIVVVVVVVVVRVHIIPPKRLCLSSPHTNNIPTRIDG